ncbi:MAG: hypothetical protein R3E58_15285 [Phycisphaerae bacterium]|nr:hypothetical protein [Phycisphaerales bacterium]
MSKVRNLDILVIKCHLVVEFVLNQFIDLAAPREGLLEIERFSFKQKAAIVFMLEFSADPVFWSNIDLLNSVRNKFAHRLEVDRDEIDRMIRLNFRDFEDSEWVANLTEARRISALKSITGAMCWYLLGFVEGISMSIDWQSGSVGGE